MEQTSSFIQAVYYEALEWGEVAGCYGYCLQFRTVMMVVMVVVLLKSSDFFEINDSHLPTDTLAALPVTGTAVV